MPSQPVQLSQGKRISSLQQQQQQKSYSKISWIRVNVSSALSVVDRLVGIVVKAPATRAEDLGYESCLHRDFSRVESHQ